MVASVQQMSLPGYNTLITFHKRMSGIASRNKNAFTQFTHFSLVLLFLYTVI